MSINFNRISSSKNPNLTPTFRENSPSVERLELSREKKRRFGRKVLNALTYSSSINDRLASQLEEMKRLQKRADAANAAASSLDDYTARLLNQMNQHNRR